MSQHAAEAAKEERAAAGILIVAGTHGFPATQARLARVAEIALELQARAAAPDIVLLAEKPFQPFEEAALGALRPLARTLHVLRPRFSGPTLGRLLGRALAAWGAAAAGAPPLGGKRHCPPRLLRLVRRLAAARRYRAAIVCGAHLAPALDVLHPRTDRLLDLERLGSEAHLDHARQGRPDALAVFGRSEEELRLLERAAAVIVTSGEDAARLRERRLARDLILAPPTGILGTRPGWGTAGAPGECERPPRLLCVGSDTVANLDGLRWFRRQVFPRILRALPTCRLRLVGEAARHIEPGPCVDRLGWLESLDLEYRQAAVVALPLRMGSGVRRRAVEALACGKVLATTAVGAYGAALEPGKDAIVCDDDDGLASAIAAVLGSDSLRGGIEERARAVARLRFHPARSFAALAARLGLASRAREPEPEREPATLPVEQV